ncbi:MAG: Dna2/Cas4 domain-containing protein [Oscillospiraceae bacterium]|nr:Dna2/Cas4 domain-containing protein [Oscillospiraceae bacterium]
MEIDRAWAENYFVVKAELVHERAHNAQAYALRGRKVHTAVRVWNDRYGLYGELDCLEEKDGGLCIVEYKPSAPEDGAYRREDAMQVFAQKLCADEVFSRDCAAQIYYADTKKRVTLPLRQEYEEYLAALTGILGEMRRLRRDGQIPPVRKGQYCAGCSMKDLCIPQASKRKGSTRERIAMALEEEI